MASGYSGGMGKLESHEPDQIRWLLSEGYSGAEVARFFGITPALVCIIRKGRGYTGIPKRSTKGRPSPFIQKIDLGTRFGRWITVSEAFGVERKAVVTCRCECGVEKTISLAILKSGQSKSCGCGRRFVKYNPDDFITPSTERGRTYYDISGATVGAWTVLKCLGRDKKHITAVYWLCRCECGTEKPVAYVSLKTGKSTNCGCRKGAPMSEMEMVAHAVLRVKLKTLNKQRFHGDESITRAKAKDSTYERKYGIKFTDAKAMLDSQDGCCAICATKIEFGADGDANLDHCHATGAVRGVLCTSCNHGLGLFVDNVDHLASAIEYLK